MDNDKFWAWWLSGFPPPKRKPQERPDVAALEAWEIESLERLYRVPSPQPPAPLVVRAGVRVPTAAEVVEQDRAMLRRWIEQYRANRRYKG